MSITQTTEYTEGVCQDGAAILRDGVPMPIEDILAALADGDRLHAALRSIRYYGAATPHGSVRNSLDLEPWEDGEV